MKVISTFPLSLKTTELPSVISSTFKSFIESSNDLISTAFPFLEITLTFPSTSWIQFLEPSQLAVV